MIRDAQRVLVLFLVLLTSLWFPSSPLLGQVGPGRPQVNGEPYFTGNMVLNKQASIFETLFGVPYDSNEWTLPLSSGISGPGSYSGTNHLGQPFTLSVVKDSPIGLRALNLDPATEGSLTAGGFQFVGVIGSLTTNLATVGITGLVITQQNSLVGFDSRLIISYSVSQNGYLFSGQDSAGDAGDGGEEGASFGFWIPIPYSCSDDECAEDCDDEYEDEIDAAEQAFNDAKDAAQADLDAATEGAQDTLNQANASASQTHSSAVTTANALTSLAMATATAALIKANISCLLSTGWTWWTGGLATAICVAGAHALYAYAIYEAMDELDQDVELAGFQYQQALDTNQAAYDQATEGAESTYSDAVATAAGDLMAAVLAAEEAYDDCIDDCTTTCYFWIWFPF